MKISCPNCSAAYELDDKRVPSAGLSIKCPKCKNPFTVHKPKAGEAAAKPAKPPGAVPLPGQQGAKAKAAAPGKPGTKLPPRPPGQSGAVPLPGSGDEAAAARMGAPPGAVPLPGLDEPPTQEEVAAGEAGGRVPLPGMGDEGMDQTAVDFRPPPRPGAQPSTGFGAVPLPGLDEKAPGPRADSGDPFSNLDMGGNEPALASRPKAAP
ncbi:MAG TPA: zinc-ribbon domain-containing protein, partial [Myxococcales bacterium]